MRNLLPKRLSHGLHKFGNNRGKKWIIETRKIAPTILIL
jgi:hypothetical protein